MPDSNAHISPLSMTSKRSKFELNAELFLAIGILALIGTLIASYMQASSGLDALKQFGRVSQQAEHMNKLRRLLLDAETATRGYLLTDDARYLDPYGKAVPQIQSTIEEIQQDYANEPNQRAAAAELIQIAQEVARILEITIDLSQRKVPLDKDWLEYGNSLMQTYRFKHNILKLNVLAENARSVEQSMRGFQKARISTVLLAIASLFLLLMTAIQKKRKQELQEKVHQLILDKNEWLEDEVNERTKELNNLATYLTNVRESEKMNLARELHDELGALLTAAKLDADWVERNLPEDVRELISQRMARLRQTLISGITLKRRITNDLRPALLFDLGLIAALGSLADEFRRGNDIDLKLDILDDEPEFSEAVSLSLFRIAQEALTNIQNYAQAHHVALSLRISKTAIELSIEDDGIGFDPDSPKLARHGLSGIKHRVFTHGGTLHIQSAPGTGTRIRVFLPL